MATLRSGAETLETPAISTPACHQIGDDGRTQIIKEETQKKTSDYEQFREERIKQNLERMQKLGIFDLSLKLKSVKPLRKNNINSNRKTPLSPMLLPPPSGPVRRSSRLQNATPVSYSEVPHKEEETSSRRNLDLLAEGSKPEAYTDEHDKLLGNTEMSWTLFVDGYGQDGRRIYDPVKGKTCHQCRQKTLGHRTHCSKCGMVQGQFCGDCLYMRYGEHVLEAQQNPNWICPVCRGICNCSLCRQAKGWPPTGTLYRKISQLGYKSVAHYLIQTRRSQTDSDKISDSELPISAKISLLFADENPTTEDKESLMPNNDNNQSIASECEEGKKDDKLIGENLNETHFPEKEPAVHSESNEYHEAFSKLESDEEIDDTNLNETYFSKQPAVNSESNDSHVPFSKPESDEKTDDQLKGEDNVDDNVDAGNKSCPRLKRKKTLCESNDDSIAGRLRQRRCIRN